VEVARGGGATSSLDARARTGRGGVVVAGSSRVVDARAGEADADVVARAPGGAAAVGSTGRRAPVAEARSAGDVDRASRERIHAAPPTRATTTNAVDIRTRRRGLRAEAILALASSRAATTSRDVA
jgi:hypothetical protein